MNWSHRTRLSFKDSRENVFRCIYFLIHEYGCSACTHVCAHLHEEHSTWWRTTRLLGWRLSVTHKRTGLLFNFQMPMNCPSEEGIGCPGSGVIESCQLPCWVLEVFLWNTSKCFWLLNHLSSPPGTLWASKIKICLASMKVSLFCFLGKHLGEWVASALLHDLPFSLLLCKSSSA